jgi:hypothetical protein
MKADTDAVIDAFGKNEQVKKFFWTFFRRDGRAGACPGCRPGDGAAGGGDDCGNGGVKILTSQKKSLQNRLKYSLYIFAHLFLKAKENKVIHS